MLNSMYFILLLTPIRRSVKSNCTPQLSVYSSMCTMRSTKPIIVIKINVRLVATYSFYSFSSSCSTQKSLHSPGRSLYTENDFLVMLKSFKYYFMTKHIPYATVITRDYYSKDRVSNYANTGYASMGLLSFTIQNFTQ